MINSRSGGSVAFKGSVLNYCYKLILCGKALVIFCTQGLLKEIIISRRGWELAEAEKDTYGVFSVERKSCLSH